MVLAFTIALITVPVLNANAYSMYTIYVNLPSGEQISLDVEDFTLILNLKHEIYEQTDIYNDQQILTFDGIILEDGSEDVSYILDYGIEHGSVLTLEERSKISVDAMTLGMNGIQNVKKNDVEYSHKIVFGTYGGSPVEWVRLSSEGLMFATTSMGQTFYSHTDSTHYPESILKTAMTNLYNNGLLLSDKQKQAVLNTTLAKESMFKDITTDLKNQKFFPLSKDEFITYVGNRTKLAKESLAEMWCLRSKYDINIGLSVMSENGELNNFPDGYDWEFGIRPAFNLDLSLVLFTSAAENGKSSFDSIATNPSLGVISSTTNTNWKMTLLDSSKNSFAVTNQPIVNDNVVSFNYTGATTGSNEYISVMITEGTSPTETITHYAKVAKPTASSGTASFTLPDTFNVGDTVNLKIFNEQDNGNNKTDLSSDLISKTITVPRNIQTDITGFSINEINGTIDLNSYTIELTMPYGTDITNLVPTITLADGATIAPLSGAAKNFTNPVIYTVTAKDGVTTKDWTVTVKTKANTSTATPTLAPTPTPQQQQSAKDVVYPTSRGSVGSSNTGYSFHSSGLYSDFSGIWIHGFAIPSSYYTAVRNADGTVSITLADWYVRTLNFDEEYLLHFVFNGGYGVIKFYR